MTKRTVNIPESVPHQLIVLKKAPEHRITLEAPCIDAHGPDLPPFIVPPSELEFGSFLFPYELVMPRDRMFEWPLVQAADIARRYGVWPYCRDMAPS